jgi:hypothetical protein
VVTRAWIAAGVDVVMVLLFAVVGRRSHSEADTVAGVLLTAWPFLVATLIGSVFGLIIRNRVAQGDAYGWGSAITVWVTTVIGGMLLRLAAGTGAAWPFWIVAFITLGILLLGWRLAARAIIRARSRTASDGAAR